jgi:membrane fusion protein, multidrug efflux system
MKSWLKAAALTLAAVLTVAVIVIPKLAVSEETGPAAEEESARVVRVIAAEKDTLDRTLRLTGTLRADESVDIRAEISGKISAIHFTEGEEVEKGRILITIDDEELRAEMEQVAADLKFATLEEERQRRLMDEGSTTQRLLEEAVNRRSVLEASQRRIESRLAKTELRAPFSGIIGLRYVSPGALIQPDTRIVALHRIQPLKIDFSVPERYLDELSIGQTFELDLTGNAQTHYGEVYAREPSIDPETRTINLRGTVENPESRLLPGAFAQVRLNLGAADEEIMIPSVAVVPGVESYVFVVSDDRVHRRQVALGRRTRDRIQVLSGLEPGELVVVAGTQNVRDGDRVRAIDEN